MRKLLSLFFAFVMVLSFVTVASAATADMNAELYYDVTYDEAENNYVLTAYLKLDSDLDVAKASNRYTGSGLYSYMVTFNGVSEDDFAYAGADVPEDEKYFGDPLAADWAGPNLGDGFLTFGGSSTGKANGLTASETPVELFCLFVNGDSEDDVRAKFSDLGYTAFKVGTVSSKASTYNLTADDITTYAVGDDGVTQHVDADYSVITPESKPGDDLITIVESDITAVADAAIDETSWQKGQGAMLKFNTADLAEFNQMNWVLNLVSGGKKFAKVDNFSVAGIDAPTVELFATFIVNEKANPEVAAYEFSSVDAGFKKADDNNVYATFAE